MGDQNRSRFFLVLTEFLNTFGAVKTLSHKIEINRIDGVSNRIGLTALINAHPCQT